MLLEKYEIIHVRVLFVFITLSFLCKYFYKLLECVVRSLVSYLISVKYLIILTSMGRIQELAISGLALTS